MYDMSHPVTVTGVMKRFEWTNPHAYIYLDVKDEKGNVVEWRIETMALNHLKSAVVARALSCVPRSRSCERLPTSR